MAQKWCPMCRGEAKRDNTVVLRKPGTDEQGVQSAREKDAVHEIECERCDRRYWITTTLYQYLRDLDPSHPDIDAFERLASQLRSSQGFASSKTDPITFPHLEAFRK